MEENKDSLDKLNNTQQEQEQEHNPNSSINLVVVVEEQQQEERNGSDVDQPPQSPRQPSSSTTTTRTPFTNLSQVDADLALARTLQEQDAEDRDMAARLLALAGINDLEADEDQDIEDHGANSQDTWEELDPDELSYEELLALGDVVGTESRGLSADIIASLPSINYNCVICRLDYEDGETLTALSCKHSYHPECINNWLNINKVCPVCSAEVSVCGNS
ncbi:e3 ubiquitin ligase big brother-related [Quercus suber]|uniref:E3 ubiquitin ligase big brother-related n=1 Tax=Quercus suber TaxID=58331 RepID=A0AAW0JZ27_QUESU